MTSFPIGPSEDRLSCPECGASIPQEVADDGAECPECGYMPGSDEPEPDEEALWRARGFHWEE